MASFLGRAVTQWLLTGLPDGHYQWAVRAVDSAFNGSPTAVGAFGIGDLSGLEPAAAVPTAYAFAENYPNPFNPATTSRC